MGKIDRIARIIVALAAVVLYLTNILTGTLGIVALVVAGVFLITSFVGVCPLYSVFGINTCSRKA